MNLSKQFGFGSLHIGSYLDEESSRDLIAYALEQGITFFDTAPLYGNARSEKILGNILSKVAHQNFSICTKVGLQTSLRKDGRFGVKVTPLNEQNMVHSVEESLRNLKRETIDLLMLHAFDSSTPIEETIEIVKLLYTQGKIQSFGCSNFNPQQMKLFLKNLKGQVPFKAAQCHYNLIERRAEHSFIPLCNKNQITVVVNRALARGALSGQYTLDQNIRKGSRAAKSQRIQKWLTPQRLELLTSLSRLAEDYHLSLATISLKWLLKNNPQMIVLMGVRNKIQLDECLSVASTEIEECVFEKVNTIIERAQSVYKSPPRYFER